jgi:hypothetical protein
VRVDRAAQPGHDAFASYPKIRDALRGLKIEIGRCGAGNTCEFNFFSATASISTVAH